MEKLDLWVFKENQQKLKNMKKNSRKSRKIVL